jgi:hypothetical protein
MGSNSLESEGLLQAVRLETLKHAPRILAVVLAIELEVWRWFTSRHVSTFEAPVSHSETW